MRRPIRKIHQFFFKFDQRALADYPLFVDSRDAWSSMQGWSYTLWDETAIEELCQTKCPQIWDSFHTLKYPIQKVDVGKMLVADLCGGLVVDLDVLPNNCRAEEIVGDAPYLFDRCSRKHTICNDFFYVGESGLPNLWEYFLENLARVDSIAAYEQRKMRYVFHSTGPDLWTRYLKRADLHKYVRAVSDRTFRDPKQRHRDVCVEDPKVRIEHQLSWVQQLHGA